MRAGLLSLILGVGLTSLSYATDVQQTIRTAQSKVVKIFGAGGFQQLEAYQSGILVSPTGQVLTAMSYVLDTDDLVVILHDGRKCQAELLGSDPITELALLKLAIEDQRLPYFELRSRQVEQLAGPGDRVLALSNLYGIATGDEPVSVLQGVITAVAPLRARRGAFQTNYRDLVYVVDAYANNPGAAGGALVDWQGQLLGILGKELRSEVTGTWLNYALPTKSFAAKIEDLRAGRLQDRPTQLPNLEQPHSQERLGFSLVPDVLPRTPPYIDAIRRGSAAESAGLRPDDLLVFVNGQPVDSHLAVINELQRIESVEPVLISVLRDGDLRELELSLPPTDDEAPRRNEARELP